MNQSRGIVRNTIVRERRVNKMEEELPEPEGTMGERVICFLAYTNTFE